MVILNALTPKGLLKNFTDMFERLYQSTLNPVIWQSDENIKPEISAKLLKIASDFYAEIKIKPALKDVLLLGSSANYNWTTTSDIDIHLVIDINELGVDQKEAQNYLNALKSKWNYEHDITIKGYNVEGYIQDVNHKTHATGIYSLMKGYWIVKPKKQKVIIDKEMVKSKYNDYVYKINRFTEEPTTVDKLNTLINDLYKMRQTGLDSSGEMSAENVVFKLLRSKGYIKRIRDLKKDVYDHSVSIFEKN